MEAARSADTADLGELTRLAGLARAELGAMRGGSLLFRREAARPGDEDTFRSLLGEPEVAVLVGTIDGVVVGYSVVRLEVLVEGTRLACVEDLYVEPEGRGVGVGEALMEEVLRWAGSRRCDGVDAFVLPGHRAAKNFFERFGLTAHAILVHRSLVESPEEVAPGPDGDPPAAP